MRKGSPSISIPVVHSPSRLTNIAELKVTKGHTATRITSCFILHTKCLLFSLSLFCLFLPCASSGKKTDSNKQRKNEEMSLRLSISRKRFKCDGSSRRRKKKVFIINISRMILRLLRSMAATPPALRRHARADQLFARAFQPTVKQHEAAGVGPMLPLANKYKWF